MRVLLGLSFVVFLVCTAPVQAQNDVTVDGLMGDWADETCSADDACDDFPNQQDAKGACIATNFAAVQPATTAYLRFDFDDTSTNGANTLDGCWLVDINQNDNVDIALCFSLVGNPSTLQETNLFTCNDSSATSCGTPTQVFLSETCAANNSTTGADMLLDCADGTDLAVECSVALTDLGYSSGNVTLLKSCTSTSAQPNSATFDCILDAETGAPWVLNPDTGGSALPVELATFVID